MGYSKTNPSQIIIASEDLTVAELERNIAVEDEDGQVITDIQANIAVEDEEGD